MLKALGCFCQDLRDDRQVKLRRLETAVARYDALVEGNVFRRDPEDSLLAALKASLDAKQDEQADEVVVTDMYGKEQRP